MHANNPSHALAVVLVDELFRCGVTDAVLAPGSRSAALAMALHDDRRIRLHVEIDERCAGFLAIGLARATGRPAPVVVTSGSAVANLHPAVVEADTGRVPLVVLSADRPPELRHTGANQTIDQIGIFAGGPRWSVEVGVPEDRPGAVRYWRSTLSRVVAESCGLSGPAGPVHCNLPFREPVVPLADDGRASPATPFSGSLDGRPHGRPWTDITRARLSLPDEALDALAGRIAGTERGLVVVGQTTTPPGPILALACAAGWPVVAEPTSGARTDVPTDAPMQPVATAHHLLADGDFAERHRPDLVLRIGRTGLSRSVGAVLDAAVEQVLIDPDGAWDDPERAVGELVVADVAATCGGLAARIPRPTATAWQDAWQRADAVARAAIDEILDADDVPSEPRTARDVGACLPDGATLVAASSMPVRDLDQFLAPRSGLRVVANRGASGIDGFVSTALGVALASRGGATVALAGDLSVLHDANGFHLSPDPATDGVSATFVVVDNDGGGIFSFLPQVAFPDSFERVFGTPHGRDLADLARLHHLGYQHVEVAGSVPGALVKAIDAGGIQLVHVRTDRADNVALHRRITAEVGRAVAAGA